MVETFHDDGVLRQLLADQAQEFAARDRGVVRTVLPQVAPLMQTPHVVVISGLRRSGKSTVQAQIADRYCAQDYYYINFDDERWSGATAADFPRIYDMLLTHFGEHRYVLLDEVQNVPEWERFVRRLHDQGHKVVLTGSNAALLSQELGTRLTGRHHLLELFPFSFAEYLQWANVPADAATTRAHARVRRAAHDYLEQGGIPQVLQAPGTRMAMQIYQDIIYRDISTRYAVQDIRSLRELGLYLMSNVGRPVSFNKLRGQLMLGSVNTIKNYIEYLESCWLFCTVNCFSHSVKQQQIAAKRLYAIDTGMVQQVGFLSSRDVGWILENAVFLQLRRRSSEIFYLKNDDGTEIDFALREGRAVAELVQSCALLRNADTRKRELHALEQAMRTHKLRQATIVTTNDAETIKTPAGKITVVPFHQWAIE